MSRFRADTMPAETEPPSPKGLPIATTQSPTRIASESPNLTKGSGEVGSTFSRAISVFGSLPISVAASEVPSERFTVISSASSITWLLVTTKPSGETTKPEPSDWTWRGPCGWPRSKKSRNRSSRSSGS